MKGDEKLKKELITILLKVYMSGRCASQLIAGSNSETSRNSEPSIDKASRLLNTQAMNLDALEASGREITWRVFLIPFCFRSFRWSHRTGR